MAFNCKCGSTEYVEPTKKRGSFVKCAKCGKWGFLEKQPKEDGGGEAKPTASKEEGGKKAAAAETAPRAHRRAGARAGKPAAPAKRKPDGGTKEPSQPKPDVWAEAGRAIIDIFKW